MTHRRPLRRLGALAVALVVVTTACDWSPRVGAALDRVRGSAGAPDSTVPRPPDQGDDERRHGHHGAASMAAPDPIPPGPQGRVGQFVVECAPSHRSLDDPIVFAGESAAGHLHEFFGNVATDADSTYDSLQLGETSCDQPLDRAAYWVPALLDPMGRPVEPVRSVAYYRVGVGVDAATVEAYPPGLKMIAGDAGATTTQPIGVVAWSCGTGSRRETAPPRCGQSTTLRVLVTFPDCWDGEHLDADDHRSHVAYSHDGSCPGSHPVAVAQLQFVVDYPPVEPGELSLASGPLTTAHADFWNVWDQDKLEREVEACLIAQRVCGVAGN